MIIPICSLSALHFWLYNYSKTHTNQYSLERRDLVSLPTGFKHQVNYEFFKELEQDLNLPAPIHTFVSNANEKRKFPDIFYHVMPAQLPDNSFIQLDHAVYIASPELCLLQIANLYPLEKLVEIANALCSTYIYNPNTDYLQSSRDPLTCVNSIKSYLSKVKNISGIRKANRAIGFALDASHSPMENKLAVLPSLSLSCGGYAAGDVELNGKIRLSKEGARMLKRDYCYCDMVWRKQKVILEYDSNLTHLDPKQHANDKKRISALNLSGYMVISVTADQVRNFYSIEQFFLSLRKALGIQPRTERLNQYFEKR